MKKRIQLRHDLSPGDVVCMTACVRDLHRNYPNQYEVGVDTSCMELWYDNVYISKLDNIVKLDEKVVIDDEDERVVRVGTERPVCHQDVIDCWDGGSVPSVFIEYPLVHQSDISPNHFTEGFTNHLEELLDIRIKNRICRGDIYVSNSERQWHSQVYEITKRDDFYWIVVNGGKMDYTAKWWDPIRMQRVVNALRNVLFVQVGSLSKGHHHVPLVGPNVINLLGRTDLRQLVRLVYHSSGVVCPITLLMHLAAAVPIRSDKCYGRQSRPCVVIAGAREPARWESYSNHSYLHTCGMLPCGGVGGCWKSRVLPVGDVDSMGRPNKLDSSLCIKAELTENGITIPKCLKMISVDRVVEAIRSYLP